MELSKDYSRDEITLNLEPMMRRINVGGVDQLYVYDYYYQEENPEIPSVLNGTLGLLPEWEDSDVSDEEEEYDHSEDSNGNFI